MTGRFVAMASVVLTFLLAQVAPAQMPGAPCTTCPPGTHGGGMFPGGGMGPGMGGPMGGSMGPGMGGGMGYPGMHSPMAHQWSGMQPVSRPYESGPANRSYDYLGAKEGPFYGDTPLEEFLKDVARDSYLRMEYLSWSYKKPGNVLLGSPVLVTEDPRLPFDVTIANQLAGRATVESMGGIKLEDVPGGRATLGIPFTFGTVEASIFSFEENSEFRLDDELGLPIPFDINDVPRFIATSTLTNGQVSNNVFLYDDFFSQRLSADLWGADFTVLLNSYLPQPAVQIRPLFGFRYIGYDEQLIQRGSFNQLGNLPEAVVTTIGSDTENNAYIGQVGLRVELPSRWVTIGLEPRVGISVNQYDNLVFSQSLRSLDDPRTSFGDQGEKLALSGEFSFYGRFHPLPNVTLQVGYTIIAVDQFSRASSIIRYNDNGPSSPADIGVRESFDLMYFQGLNVGGEIRF